jgi:hypothetical protein
MKMRINCTVISKRRCTVYFISLLRPSYTHPAQCLAHKVLIKTMKTHFHCIRCKIGILVENGKFTRSIQNDSFPFPRPSPPEQFSPKVIRCGQERQVSGARESWWLGVGGQSSAE